MAFVARRRDRPSEISIRDQTSISIDSATINVPVTTAAAQHIDTEIVSAITLNIQITGSTINVPMEIKGPLDAGGRVNVGIGSSITLNMNIAGSEINVPVVNPVGGSLNVGITSAVTLNIAITGSTINVPMEIKGPLDAGGRVNVGIGSSITLNMNIAGSEINVPVVNPVGGSLNVGITSAVTLNIAITGSTINVPVFTPTGQHVDVDVTSSVTLNVAIQSSAVTLNVNIAASAVTLNVSVQGTAKVNITDAIVNISALKLMDAGTLQRVSGSVGNATLVLYTVPTGKKAYLFSASMSVKRTNTGTADGDLYVYDGATAYKIFSTDLAASVYHANHEIGFTFMSIPAGWSIRIEGGPYSTVRGSCVVVEVNA